MKYIITIKDEQNEISISFDMFYKAMELAKEIVENSQYRVEIMMTGGQENGKKQFYIIS